jgi:hypothetical protein
MERESVVAIVSLKKVNSSYSNMKKWIKEFAFITKSLELLCILKCLKMLVE